MLRKTRIESCGQALNFEWIYCKRLGDPSSVIIMTSLRRIIFNYMFVTEPDGDLKCAICLEVAQDPTQHGKCGKLFCSECIDKNGNMPCPICRAENPQYFADGKSKLIKTIDTA